MKLEVIQPSEATPDYAFFCPGCRCSHGVWTTSRNTHNAMWQFNGDLNKPSFSPSVRVQHNTEEKGDIMCHSWITDGMIKFESDSTHELAGQTVELPEIQ